MKKIFLITTLAALVLTSCVKKAEAAEANDMVVTSEDTTMVDQNTMADDTASVATDTTSATTTTDSKGKLLDKISVTTVKTNPAAGKFALANTKWKLVELMGKEVKNTSNKDYVLVMDSKTGKFTGYAGCNNIMGSYLMKDANSLTFLYVGATKMACPDMKTEEKLMKALGRVDNYMIDGNMLHLHKGKRDAFAKFEAIN